MFPILDVLTPTLRVRTLEAWVRDVEMMANPPSRHRHSTAIESLDFFPKFFPRLDPVQQARVGQALVALSGAFFKRGHGADAAQLLYEQFDHLQPAAQTAFLQKMAFVIETEQPNYSRLQRSVPPIPHYEAVTPVSIVSALYGKASADDQQMIQRAVVHQLDGKHDPNPFVVVYLSLHYESLPPEAQAQVLPYIDRTLKALSTIFIYVGTVLSETIQRLYPKLPRPQQTALADQLNAHLRMRTMYEARDVAGYTLVSLYPQLGSQHRQAFRDFIMQNMRSALDGTKSGASLGFALVTRLYGHLAGAEQQTMEKELMRGLASTELWTALGAVECITTHWSLMTRQADAIPRMRKLYRDWKEPKSNGHNFFNSLLHSLRTLPEAVQRQITP